jgi:hypothetical protein
MMQMAAPETKAATAPPTATTTASCASCSCSRAAPMVLTSSSLTPTINAHPLVAPLAETMCTWRRHFHANPELGYSICYYFTMDDDCIGFHLCHVFTANILNRFEEIKTAAFIAEKLRSWSIDEVIEVNFPCQMAQ